eukprot:467302-Prorocentrum_minimum.AAC.1
MHGMYELHDKLRFQPYLYYTGTDRDESPFLARAAAGSARFRAVGEQVSRRINQEPEISWRTTCAIKIATTWR